MNRAQLAHSLCPQPFISFAACLREVISICPWVRDMVWMTSGTQADIKLPLCWYWWEGPGYQVR